MPLYSSPNVSTYCMNNTLIHDAPTNGTPTCRPSVSPAHWLKEMTVFIPLYDTERQQGSPRAFWIDIGFTIQREIINVAAG